MDTKLLESLQDDLDHLRNRSTAPPSIKRAEIKRLEKRIKELKERNYE